MLEVEDLVDLSDNEKVHNRLRTFVKDFVFIYESSLSEYYKRLESRMAKPGKWVSIVNEVIGLGKDGAGFIRGPDVKIVSMMGINILQKAIPSIGSKHNREELKKLIGQLYIFKEDSSKVREELVKSGVEIFQVFESQFVQVTADGSWERAMTKLAEDAVSRVVDYYRKNTEKEFCAQSMTEGIVFGKSKKYKQIFADFPRIESGHTLKSKSLNSWNTAKVFDKTGLVTTKSDGSADKYYKKKDGKSNTSKYGYRLLFKWESEDRVKLERKLDVEYQEENLPKAGYKYIFKLDEKEKLEIVLLNEINNQDPKLVEERLKESFKAGMEQIKQEAEKSVNKLEKYVSGNFDQLLDYVKNNQREIREVFNELMRQNQEVASSVEEGRKESREGFQGASQERKKIADDNEKEHKKTQQEINELKKVIIEPNSLQKKVPIWFNVRESVASFTGREEQLDEIAHRINQRIVVISGLGGVGKSELAIKYAREHYSEKDSVVWINAQTHETAKDSFRKLMKELGLKTKDQDNDEKSIGLMAKEVYGYFTGKKSLFIFDNAENYIIIKEFLPSSTSDCYVLITSQNYELFNEQECVKIEKLSLSTLPEDKATEFVKKALSINNALQDKEIKELVGFLGYLPLALQHAVSYIKESGYIENIGKCLEIYKKSEQEIQSLLNRKGLSSYDKTIFLTFKTTIDKVKQEENGELAEEVLNTIAYFAPDNISKRIFLKLAQDRVEESDISIKNERANGMLTRAINLLGRYFIINLREEQINIHRLVQRVIGLELKKQSEEVGVLEQEVLGKALALLREYMVNQDSTENYIPHIISVWKYASKHDKLIESFIVSDIINNPAHISYFHLIAESSDYEIVNRVLDKIKDPKKLHKVVNTRSEDKKTPLHYAAQGDNEEVIRLLISKKANVDTRDRIDNRPLHIAVKNGFLGGVRALLDSNKVDVNAVTSSKYKFTPLHLATQNGHLEIVNILLERNADINARTKREFTPLHLAADNGHIDVAEALLKDKKITIDAETEYKFTPLHLAAKKGYVEIVKALLKANAKIDAADKGNFTPLHLAAQNGHLEVVNVLLDEGAKIDTQTTKGNTALHLAAKNGQKSIEQVLLGRRANINIKNKDGKTYSDILPNTEVTDLSLFQYQSGNSL